MNRTIRRAPLPTGLLPLLAAGCGGSHQTSATAAILGGCSDDQARP
jgi:hypothetical protein